ncbi:H-NS histone family protein [Paraburkholderia sp. JPY432]|nr:H-NS histone family protein [Paraburkholderia youngii]NVH76332.1 H-NS histone family protein [Paraburkholderia youngii]
MRGKIADGEARDRLIIWLRRRMEEFGITLEALAESIQHDVDHPPLYRDARGNEWNGLGDMPDWLRAASNAGVSPDFFRIESKPAPQPMVGTENIDPRQPDLFA